MAMWVPAVQAWIPEFKSPEPREVAGPEKSNNFMKLSSGFQGYPHIKVSIPTYTDTHK